MKLRIKFNKHGAVRYIGHLDVMRFFQKAFRRAELDIAYSSGFSPHQIMSFAQPLGVGLESNGEYMDVEMNSIVSCEDVKAKLNESSIPGIQILNVKILPPSAGNAMASVYAASYTVSFRPGREPNLDIASKLCDFLSNEQILITKETKKGTHEVDLKPGIYKLTWDNNKFHMLLDASSAGNIKPIQVIESLLNSYGESLQGNALFITREDTFAEGFVPLDSIGITDAEYKESNFEQSNQ